MKNGIKMLIVFVLSFLSIFYDFNGLNILLCIPIFAFFMFNGLKSFLTSLLGLIIGSITSYFMYQSYFNIIYLLIALCIYFLLYHISLLIHKKLIINFFTSCLFSISITYLIYSLSNHIFSFENFLFYFVLAAILSFLFAFLLKNFSFYLLTYHDNYSPIITFSLLILYTSQLQMIIPNPFYTIILCLFIALVLAIKTNLLNILAFNCLTILLGYLFDVPLLFHYAYMFIFITLLLSFNHSKNRIINSLSVLFGFCLLFFFTHPSPVLHYFIMAFILAISILIINPKQFHNFEDQYYQLYIKNKKETISQLNNFQKMFATLSENFTKSRQSRILSKAKEEVFDTLCYNCPEVEKCHKKGKHLLLNYIKDSLNNELDENKIRYIKQNCVKQETYFTLLEKFTTTYLLNNYQKEEQAKMKAIIANDFNGFAKIMEQCQRAYSNDRLILAHTFYQNLKKILQDYEYDILFVNNHSTLDYYQFDIAIENIELNEIRKKLIPIIDSVLQTNMEILKIDTATLSSSYFILSIKEIEDLKINYYVKQSNEDIKANGDSFSMLTENKYFFFALSDGMGHGLEANEESKFTLDTLMSLLKTNMDIKTSIHLTNDIIQLKNDYESYTTLDLLAIDKKRKIASFYKHGAFNAFIIRNHQVSEISNFSLPLGIVDKVNPSPSSYKIQKNDIIIMCSDGMIDDTNKGIYSILEEICFDDPVVICNTLFSHLIEVRQNSDDATLAIITIS